MVPCISTCRAIAGSPAHSEEKEEKYPDCNCLPHLKGSEKTVRIISQAECCVITMDSYRNIYYIYRLRLWASKEEKEGKKGFRSDKLG